MPRILSIDVGVKNLGIVAFEYNNSVAEKECIILKSRSALNIPPYKSDKTRTMNQKIYDAVIEKCIELSIDPTTFDQIFIEQQMATNTTAIRVQSILYTYFATLISASKSNTIIRELSPQIKLRRFVEEDCTTFNIRIKPVDPTAKRKQTFGSRLTSRNKKKLGAAFCKKRHGVEFTFDEADALLQAINYLGID